MRVLLPIELAWRGVNGLRRRAYEKGLLEQKRLPRPVISVGNVSAGGSGKTPTVIHIARFLSSRGWKVAILSRGYRRAGRGVEIVGSDDAGRYGDEPVLIRRHVPEADVVVGPRRFEAGRWYLQQSDCDLFLLDDGFQHLSLHRDVDVVIDDPAATHLRESRRAIRKADITLIRGRDGTADAASSRFRLQVEPTAVVLGGERHGLGTFVGRKVAAFAGLAHNDRFFRSIEELGGHLVATESFRDHVTYDEELLARIEGLRFRNGADLLVTTEKDWVKIPSIEVGVMIVEAVVTPYAEFHERLIELLENARLRLGRIGPDFERTHG